MVLLRLLPEFRGLWRITGCSILLLKMAIQGKNLKVNFSLLKWELPSYNELNTDFKPVPGQILYLQPKREKAEAGKDFYTTVEGDTMYLVSQKFGIKVKESI